MTRGRSAPSASSSGRKAAKAAAEPVSIVPPYPPSWVDRFTEWVDRLPIPWWSFYLAVAFLLEGLQIYILFSGGIFESHGVHFFQFYFPVNFVLAMFLMHAFDRRAITALGRFRPALRAEASEQRLRYELTTLPARPTIVAGLAGLAFGVLGFLGTGMNLRTYPLFGMNATQAGLIFIGSAFIPTLFVWFTLSYHTIHQLRTVRRIYRHETQVDLYRLRPSYAMAELAAVSAIGFAIYTYPWLEDLLNAAPELEAGILILNLPFFFWPLVIFLWPLWGAHRTLVELKETALGEAALRAKRLATDLHDRIDGGRLAAIDEVHKAITALEFENSRLLKIPTWPWSPGTFRTMLATVFLPLALWLAQFALQRYLAR